MILTAIIMILLALLGSFLFDTKILFGILMILCGVGVLVTELVLKKKIERKPVRMAIFGGLILLYLACALLPKPASAAPAGEAVEVSATAEEEDALHLQTARELTAQEEYDRAEEELAQVSDQGKTTEDWYLRTADIRMEKTGFDAYVKQENLDFLIQGVRDCPESLELNYRAGILAYALGEYITAENYLARAFELSPEEDPYTPYALAAVYRAMDDDAMAYTLMTIAEKNGMLDSGECDGEALVDWYLEWKDELAGKEAAE